MFAKNIKNKFFNKKIIINIRKQLFSNKYIISTMESNINDFKKKEQQEYQELLKTMKITETNIPEVPSKNLRQTT